MISVLPPLLEIFAILYSTQEVYVKELACDQLLYHRSSLTL